jgi:hypothetical protein
MTKFENGERPHRQLGAELSRAGCFRCASMSMSDLAAA